MTLRNYLMIIVFNIIISWFVLVLMIIKINPELASFAMIFFFYSILFIALLGTFFILNFLLRLKLRKDIVIIRELKKAMRQSFLISLSIIVSLIMSHLQVLTWWNFSLLLIGFILLDLLYISYKS